MTDQNSLHQSSFWSTLCGDEVPLDFQSLCNSSVPAFSDCFNNTLLSWPAPVFLLFATVFSLPRIISTQNCRLKWTWSMIVKLLLLGLIFTITTARVGLQLHFIMTSFPISLASTLSCFLHWFCNIVLFVLTELYRRNGHRSPGIVWLGWFVLTISSIMPFIQAVINTSNGKLREGLGFYSDLFYICYCPLILAELVLNSFSDCPGHVINPDEKECPEKRSSFLSRITFAWFTKTAVTGYKRPLTMDDLWNLHPIDTSKAVSSQRDKKSRGAVIINKNRRKLFSRKTRNILAKMTIFGLKSPTDPKKSDPAVDHASDQASNHVADHVTSARSPPSLLTTLIESVKWRLIPAIILRLIGDLSSFIIPQILKLLLTFIDTPTIPLWIGLLLVAMMFLCSIVQTMFQQQGIYGYLNVAMNVKTSLASLVYKKALQLSPSSMKEVSVGETLNYMAVDIQKVGESFQQIHQLWTTPIMIAVSLYLLYLELGYSSLVGFAVMFVLIPITYAISNYQKRNQAQMMRFKDQRMKLMNEIVRGMKMLKFNAWEEPFEKKVLGIRRNEVNTLKVGAYYDSINTLLTSCTPFLVAAGSFSAYVLSSADHVLTPQKAFVSLALFNILRQPLNNLPRFMSILVQASVSYKRLRRFLASPELPLDTVNENTDQDEAILIRNGTFSWSTGDKPILEGINLSVRPGQLVAIIGPVGCGKSSLLSAILGDMVSNTSAALVKGSVAYVPQQPWIQNMTLRDNILFADHSYPQHHYIQVLTACALTADLDILPDGDQTEIGERGVNLSGGQKQRVSLARAVYQDCDVYLMDDPLSAVDSHVGKHIYDHVIGKEGLLNEKTRVLVTHNLSHLKHMDNIIVMKEGKIIQSGTLQELMQQGGTFKEYITNRGKDELMSNETTKDTGQNNDIFSGDKGAKTGSSSSGRGATLSGINSPAKSVTFGQTAAKGGGNAKYETVQKGRMKRKTYTAYFSAVGYGSFVGVVVAYAAHAAFSAGTNVWLAEWSGDSKNHTMDVDRRLEVYYGLGIGQGVSIFLASLIGVRLMASASVHLHHHLLFTLIRLPLTFYDVTPLGDIMSRIGKDMDIIDNNLPLTLRLWIMQTFSIVSAIIVITISTPLIAVAILPLGFGYYFLQKFCVSTGRQLRRLESATRGPILSHFSETLAGASSIRAYKAQRRFIEEANIRCDQNTKVVYATTVSFRWREVWFHLLGNLLVMFTGLFAVLGRDNGVDAGMVGLSVTYAASITNTLQIAVRLLGDLETDLVAIERIQEYRNLQTEGPWITSIRPPERWPHRGAIDFRKLQFRYREGHDLVLKGLNWSIDSNEKAGVVGRTGAGKSSMTLALFRIVEPSGGTIVIDDIDITKIGLHDLRSRLAIIPQDPILFSGTLRINLDPFDEHEDSEVWMALEQAHLKQFVGQLSDGLQYKVTEGGGNLSVGQRQLLCLARALLRRSRILVLDEATAAVDLETEKLILDTIRDRFGDCTIITIAHRLNTVIDSDKILVMSQGRALEHGSPESLLADSNSSFYAMAKESGLIT